MALTKITATNIGANAVTANSIGYTPANKAGDTFTGAIAAPGVSSTNGMNINGSTFEAALRMTNTGAGGQDYYLFSTMNSFTQGGGKFMVYNGGNGHAYDWAIDSAGRVLAPYQPAIHIRGMTASPNANLTGGSTAANRNMTYNSTNGRVTVAVAGVYLIQASAFTNATNTYISVRIRLNGTGTDESECFGQSTANYSYASATTTVMLALSAGDYINAFIPTGSSVYNGGWGCTLSVALLG